jgi:ATP-dependent Clp protease ATP-binding subunit ClpA
VVDQNPEGKYEALTKYGRDLTQAAREGKLDPVIGRDDEVRRCIQVIRESKKEGYGGAGRGPHQAEEVHCGGQLCR